MILVLVHSWLICLVVILDGTGTVDLGVKIGKNFWSYHRKILRDHFLESLMGSFYITLCWSYSREIFTLLVVAFFSPTSIESIVYNYYGKDLHHLEYSREVSIPIYKTHAITSSGGKYSHH